MGGAKVNGIPLRHERTVFRINMAAALFVVANDTARTPHG
jgi:hypothetical protein